MWDDTIYFRQKHGVDSKNRTNEFTKKTGQTLSWKGGESESGNDD